jgi:hypothetical protein
VSLPSFAVGPAASNLHCAAVTENSGNETAGGANTWSAPNEHKGQCGTRCIAPVSTGTEAGFAVAAFASCEMHRSSCQAVSAGRALAISGQSELTAMARIASHQASFLVVPRECMARIYTRGESSPQASGWLKAHCAHRRQTASQVNLCQLLWSWYALKPMFQDVFNPNMGIVFIT